MKRLLCMILALLLLLMAVGCNETAKKPPEESDTQERGTEPDEDITTGNPQQTTVRKPTIYDAQVVQFPLQDWKTLQEKLIGADFFEAPLNADRLALNDGKEHLPIFRIDTMEQLDTFNTLIRELSPSGSTYFASATQEIKQSYFENHTLFIAHATTENVGLTFRIDLDNTADNVLTFNLVCDPNTTCFDAIGNWLALIPIDKRVHLDGATEFDAILTEPSFVETGITQMVRVQYFDTDYSSKCAEFYAEALNPEQLQKRYSMRTHVPIFRFDSLEELTAFNETYRELLDHPGSHTPATVTDATSFMNEKFFETQTLIAVYVISGSGSFQYHLENVEKTNGRILVHIAQDPFPDDCDYTCDMAAWMALIPIEKSALEDVTVFDAIRTEDH